MGGNAPSGGNSAGKGSEDRSVAADALRALCGSGVGFEVGE